MNYEWKRDDGLLFTWACTDTQEIAFVASKFAIISLLLAINAVLKK